MKGFKSNFKSIILLCLYIKYFRLFGFTGSQVSWIPTHIPCLNTKAEACCVAFDPLPAKIPHSLLSLVHYLWCVLTKKWYQKILVTYLQVVPMNCSYLLTMIKPRMLKQCNKNIDSNTTIQVFSVRIHTMFLVQPMLYVQSCIFCDLDLPFPSSRLHQHLNPAGIHAHVLAAQQQDEKATTVASSTTVCSANALQQQPQHCCPSFWRWSASILAQALKDTQAHP